jgi:hypothetical protein
VPFWCFRSSVDSADLRGFSPDFVEGNMSGCFVHFVDDLVRSNSGKPL